MAVHGRSLVIDEWAFFVRLEVGSWGDARMLAKVYDEDRKRDEWVSDGCCRVLLIF